MPPAPLEGEAAEHARLARAGRRAPRGARASRVPEAGEDVHATALDLGGLGVLVLVDHVLRGALGHEQLGLGLHPGRHERREVEPGVAVQHQLVVDDLEGGPRRHALGRRSRRRGTSPTSPCWANCGRKLSSSFLVGIGRVLVEWHGGTSSLLCKNPTGQAVWPTATSSLTFGVAQSGGGSSLCICREATS